MGKAELIEIDYLKVVYTIGGSTKKMSYCT